MRIWIGYEDPDSLLTYPDADNLSASSQSIRIGRVHLCRRLLAGSLCFVGLGSGLVWRCGRCSGLQVVGRGGFALHEARWRRVAGVSEPLVVQFPPIGGQGRSDRPKRRSCSAIPPLGGVGASVWSVVVA